MSHPKTKLRITLLVILAFTSITLLETSFTIRPVQATARGINLLGFVSAWNASTTGNPTLTVVQGDLVTINAKPGDGAPHQWFLDVDNNGVADCSPGPDICGAQFSTSNASPLTFTVAFAMSSYTFTYYCAVHPGTMHGSFTAIATGGGGRGYRLE